MTCLCGVYHKQHHTSQNLNFAGPDGNGGNSSGGAKVKDSIAILKERLVNLYDRNPFVGLLQLRVDDIKEGEAIVSMRSSRKSTATSSESSTAGR